MVTKAKTTAVHIQPVTHTFEPLVPGEQEDKGMLMAGNAAVEGGEHFQARRRRC